MDKTQGESQNMFLANKPEKIGKATASCGTYNVYNASHSSAGVNEDSSDESIDLNRDLSATKKKKFDHTDAADGIIAQNNVTVLGFGTPDFESPDSAESMVKMAQNSGMILNASGTGAVLTKEDDHELKLAKRRQSNKESARRSRWRKQEEIIKLRAAVEELKAENSMLKDELSSLSKECVKLKDKDAFIMEELKRIYRPDAISSLTLIPGLLNHESYRSK